MNKTRPTNSDEPNLLYTLVARAMMRRKLRIIARALAGENIRDALSGCRASRYSAQQRIKKGLRK